MKTALEGEEGGELHVGHRGRRVGGAKCVTGEGREIVSYSRVGLWEPLTLLSY